MRIQRPQLPVPPAKDTFSMDLIFKLKQIIASINDQLNRLNEGCRSGDQRAAGAAQ